MKFCGASAKRSLLLKAAPLVALQVLSQPFLVAQTTIKVA